MTLTLSLILFFICLLLSAFFSSSETAFISLQKLRVRHLVSTGVGGAKRVSRIIEKPGKLLATVLLGNNFFNTAAAALGTVIAVSLLGRNAQAVVVATVTVTLLLLIFGEITPKTLATRHGERMALAYVRPIEIISWLFYPAVVVLGWVGAGLARIVGGAPPPRSLVSEEEIRTIISVGREEGVVEEAEADMLSKVFEFGDRHVRETMIPRADIVWVEKGTNLADFFSLYAQYPYSHFPVYEDSIDNVIGVLSIKDVFLAQAKGLIDQGSAVTDLAGPGYFVPESKHIGELFSEMQAEGKQTAIVVDEFGGTAGLVTLQRLAEEIMGRFGDELARGARGFEVIDENTFQIDGGMHIDQANKELGLALPEGHYETVAGFILSLLGHIPKEGDQLKYDGLRLVITEMRGIKIGKILITRG